MRQRRVFSGNKLGRLTVWDSGEAEVQVQDFHTNKTESLSTLIIDTKENLTRALSELVKSLETKYA